MSYQLYVQENDVRVRRRERHTVWPLSFQSVFPLEHLRYAKRYVSADDNRIWTLRGRNLQARVGVGDSEGAGRTEERRMTTAIVMAVWKVPELVIT